MLRVRARASRWGVCTHGRGPITRVADGFQFETAARLLTVRYQDLPCGIRESRGSILKSLVK